MKRKIYVACSWRNEHYPEVVEKLMEAADLGFNCFYIEPYMVQDMQMPMAAEE